MHEDSGLCGGPLPGDTIDDSWECWCVPQDQHMEQRCFLKSTCATESKVPETQPSKPNGKMLRQFCSRVL